MSAHNGDDRHGKTPKLDNCMQPPPERLPEPHGTTTLAIPPPGVQGRLVVTMCQATPQGLAITYQQHGPQTQSRKLPPNAPETTQPYEMEFICTKAQRFPQADQVVSNMGGPFGPTLSIGCLQCVPPPQTSPHLRRGGGRRMPQGCSCTRMEGHPPHHSKARRPKEGEEEREKPPRDRSKGARTPEDGGARLGQAAETRVQKTRAEKGNNHHNNHFLEHRQATPRQPLGKNDSPSAQTHRNEPPRADPTAPSCGAAADSSAKRRQIGKRRPGEGPQIRLEGHNATRSLQTATCDAPPNGAVAAGRPVACLHGGRRPAHGVSRARC